MVWKLAENRSKAPANSSGIISSTIAGPGGVKVLPNLLTLMYSHPHPRYFEKSSKLAERPVWLRYFAECYRWYKSEMASSGIDDHEQASIEDHVHTNRPTARHNIRTERPPFAGRKSLLGAKRHKSLLSVSSQRYGDEEVPSSTTGMKNGAPGKHVRFQGGRNTGNPSHRLRAIRRGATNHASNSHARFAVQNDALASRGHVSRRDGRLNISI